MGWAGVVRDWRGLGGAEDESGKSGSMEVKKAWLAFVVMLSLEVGGG